MRSVLRQLRGKGLKKRFLNPLDELWDRRLGVRTFGFHPATKESDATDLRVHYAPTPYREIFRLLEIARLGPEDVFVDLGAGLGRAVFAASWMGVKSAVGVEIVPWLCEQARENHRASRVAHRDVSFVCTDATDYAYDDVTVLFMFHPFGEATLRQVISKLESSRRRAPLRILYRNPVFEHVLQQAPWLRCVERLENGPSWLSAEGRYMTSYWESRR